MPGEEEPPSVSPRTRAWKPRRWLTVLVSLLSPGAGHLYSGDLRGAVLFWVAVCVAGGVIKVSYALTGYSTKVYLALIILIGATLMVLAARSAWLAARRYPPERTPRPYQRLWFVLIAAVLMAEVPTRVARAFVMQSLHVPTDAMAPALVEGDFLFVTKLGPRARPERGAIVAFRPPGQEDVEVVKRVVAMEGDQVEVRDGAVWVNGEQVSPSGVRGWAPAVTIPPEHIYVLGDNPAESGLDSRVLGPIPLDEYVGRVHGIYMSKSIARIGTTL